MVTAQKKREPSVSDTKKLASKEVAQSVRVCYIYRRFCLPCGETYIHLYIMTQTTTITVEQLFAVGAHYGFTKRRRHPSVLPYLYGSKEGNDIIDLDSTASQLAAGVKTIQEAVANGKTVLFVGTKDEAAQIVRSTAVELGAPYVTNRWIGGMLTNFSEVKKRIQRLETLQNERESGAWERKYTKKERVMLGRELAKLEFNFGGIQQLRKVPDLLVVIDPRFEQIAIEEAQTLNIPVLAVSGTDCNVKNITYPVVMNDSLKESVTLALQTFMDGYRAGLSAQKPATATATRSSVPRSASRSGEQARA